MNAIKATVVQSRLELSVRLDWPDGTEVLIEPTTARIMRYLLDTIVHVHRAAPKDVVAQLLAAIRCT
jgi:hypothetical protein